MDLPVTAPTPTQFDYSNIRVLHLEPTTVCNASCPQCARMDPAFYNHEQHVSELRISQLQQIVPEQLIRQLDKMFMCGNFGDPAAAKDTLQIYQYFRALNPKITLGMNTNGGLRTKFWWQELASIMKGELDYVVFSIDGLEDTNHIYRVDVNWDNVISNAEAFVSAGGHAHWDMLVYEHNQHQVDSCRELARKLGFVQFRTKVTNRFKDRPIEFLQPPAGHREKKSQGPVACHALQENSIYVSANGMILPCCFFGSQVFQRQFEWAGPDLRSIVSSFNNLPEQWASKPDATCARYCTKSTWKDQWKTEEALC
jgi:MoaA/NifB/PqqE/SkfB family radical SAM enzyme